MWLLIARLTEGIAQAQKVYRNSASTPRFNITTEFAQSIIAAIRSLQAQLEGERGIVNRIWAIFGSPSYKELKGRSIYDLIEAERKARKEYAIDAAYQGQRADTAEQREREALAGAAMVQEETAKVCNKVKREQLSRTCGDWNNGPDVAEICEEEIRTLNLPILELGRKVLAEKQPCPYCQASSIREGNEKARAEQAESAARELWGVLNNLWNTDGAGRKEAVEKHRAKYGSKS